MILTLLFGGVCYKYLLLIPFYALNNEPKSMWFSNIEGTFFFEGSVLSERNLVYNCDVNLNNI